MSAYRTWRSQSDRLSIRLQPVRARKESLSKAHNLSLEQIEWAYALSVTLQGFESLSFDRQHTILQTLCGIRETYQYDFSTLSELWDVESTLNPETTAWLLEGLSQPEAGEIKASA